MSLKRSAKALVHFFRQSGLPVYQSGRVPNGAKFPFITLTLSFAPYAQPSGITATAWFQEEAANTRCVEWLDDMCALVPPGGALMRYAGGGAMLHRMSGDFASLVRDESDPSVLGARLRLNMHLYDA